MRWPCNNPIICQKNQMPRFYCPQSLILGSCYELPAEVAHHVRVRRLTPGGSITLFNGTGGEYRATLAAIGKAAVSVNITEFAPHESELAYQVTLAQALPEAAKMDWIVEKAVELGVSNIAPLATQRCVVKLSGERADKKREHWQRVAIAASEQSGRNRLTEIAPISTLERWLKQAPGAVRLMLTPRAGISLAAWARQQQPQILQLLIGPEGGLNEEEERLATAHGVLAVSLGARILRTETAGLAALATLNAHWD